MIRLTPPKLNLTPPQRESGLRRILPVGDSMAVCETAGNVQVELYGQTFPGPRMLTTLPPSEAIRLGQELLSLGHKLSA